VTRRQAAFWAREQRDDAAQRLRAAIAAAAPASDVGDRAYWVPLLKDVLVAFDSCSSL